MEDIKNFKRYHPVSKGDEELEENINAIFLISEDGQDWYECQSKFGKSTIKLMYDTDGVVRSISTDISTFYPEDKSIAEIPFLPEGVTIDGDWQYDGGRVMPRVKNKDELVSLAEQKKAVLLNKAEQSMAPLRDAIELDIATRSEKDNYLLWKKYRVLLSRLDTTLGENIHWPSTPA